VTRRSLRNAALLTGALLLLTVPSVSAGGSRIVRVSHIGPDAGLMEVVPDVVSFSRADGSVTVGGTLVCPAEAGSLGVVVTVRQDQDGTPVAGESWDNVVQCGGRISTTTVGADGQRFNAGVATIEIGAFVCDLHCGSDFIAATVVLKATGNEVKGPRKIK
jgi:hypothetical protein